MKRRGLFFIGLISAIVTIISLNVAFGKSGFYNERYSYYGRYHHCYGRYDDRYKDEKNHRNEKQNADSTNSNY